jgi:carbamoyltransferase
MKVLGISPLDKDANVSIVEDGQVLFAAGEERFSRVKQQDGFPTRALEAALKYTGTRLEEIELVAYPFLTAENEQKLIDGDLEDEKAFLANFNPPDLKPMIRDAQALVPRRESAIHGLKNPNEMMEKGLLHNTFYRLSGAESMLSSYAATQGSKQWRQSALESFRRWEQELLSGLAGLGLESKIRRMDHHLSHAANAFLTSGFERALCITLDGYGSGLAGSVSEGHDGKIKRLHGVNFPNSLGSLYEHVTSSIGFKPGRHEGKIVGLASYGDPKILSDVLLSRIWQKDGDFKIAGANSVFFSRYLASKFPKIDVAAAYQHVLEVVATKFVKYWVDKTGIDTVVLSGGVTANVKLNQRIFEIEGVNHIYVYPNMGDGGCGTGAALYHSWPGGTRESYRNAYFGPDYSDKEIATCLEAAGLAFEPLQNYAETIAKLIHEGKVVARFNGRMEYGPRALGNRSIMYHAREPEVNQWLNKRLGRTEFMPFAPVSTWESRERLYHNVKGAEHAAEFMTITFDCTDEMRRECPAAVHVDGTARPQLVKREQNPGYYDILKEYEKLSGVPCLINTSFNMHEEPIVCSPDDAVRAFLDGCLDYLAIGPFLVRHPNAEH